MRSALPSIPDQQIIIAPKLTTGPAARIHYQTTSSHIYDPIAIVQANATPTACSDGNNAQYRVSQRYSQETARSSRVVEQEKETKDTRKHVTERDVDMKTRIRHGNQGGLGLDQIEGSLPLPLP